MARRFGSTPFCEVLPHNLAQDSTVRNAADALDGILAKSALALPELLIYARLAESPLSQLLPPLERIAILAGGLTAIPEPLLDLLAWQFHVDGYEAAVSLAAKRAMVFSSIILHRKRGTPWAVKYGLETTLQVPAKIAEWFEYGGDPYFFRVTLDVSGVAIDARAIENAVKIIFAHKNVRSWLEWLRTKSVRKLPVSIAPGAVHFTKNIAFTWRWPLVFEGFSAFYGSFPAGRSSAAITFRNNPTPQIEFSPRTALCACGMSRARTVPGFSGSLAAVRSFLTSAAYAFTRSKICPRQM